MMSSIKENELNEAKKTECDVKGKIEMTEGEKSLKSIGVYDVEQFESCFRASKWNESVISKGSDYDSDSEISGSDDVSVSFQISNSLSNVSLRDCDSSATISTTSGVSSCAEEDSVSTVGIEATKSIFHNSLFPNVAPTINFCLPDDNLKVEVPEGVKSLLKWQLTRTTPVAMKKILLCTGFKFVKQSNTWIGTWGRHMKSLEFQHLKPYQKINHYPGTFQIGRKDKLWRNISHMQKVHGIEEFGFVPLTFVLPNDLRKLWLFWDHNGNSERWIVKPPASARGKGIQVIHKFAQLPKQGSFVVQKYITKPYLINGTKFDLRLYVYVSCFNPLRIYLYEDGLVRFASVSYSNSVNSLKDRYVHLTNSSVNRTNENYTIGSEKSFVGHKWTLQTLWTYLKQRGVDTSLIWNKITDLVVKTIISCEPCVSLLTRANVSSRYNCHEVFGFDVMLDESFRPWLLEVNISPSLHSSSPLDARIKGSMLKDLLNIAGFRIPPLLSNTAQTQLSATLQLDPTSVSLDTRLFNDAVSADHKLKQNYYSVYGQQKYVSEILEHLTPNDIRHLVESEDELTRIGQFQRIFPSSTSFKYHKFFPSPRYNSNLLDAWEQTYHSNRTEGHHRLTELCNQRLHLKCAVESAKQTITETSVLRRIAVVCRVGRSFRSRVHSRCPVRNYGSSTLSAIQKLQRKRAIKPSKRGSCSASSSDDSLV